MKTRFNQKRSIKWGVGFRERRFELLEDRRVLAVVPYVPMTIFEGGLEASQQIEIFDVDSDGDLDAVALSGNTAATFLNDGAGQFTEPIPFENELTNETRSMTFADFDNDGDFDVVIGSRGNEDEAAITLHRNDGAGQFGQAAILATGSDDTYIDHLDVGDLDDDGDLDIVAVGRDSSRVLIIYNIGDSGRFAAPIDVSRQIDGARSVKIADMDGDTDNDIIVVSSFVDAFDSALNMHRLTWFANVDGKFEQTDNSLDIGPGGRFLDAADFDGDGDVDIVLPEQGNDRLIYIMNTDGLGSLQIEQIIADELAGAERVVAYDLDLDGDQDAVVTVDNGGKVVWFENVDGQFGDEQVIDDEVQQASGLSLGDLDGDGDIDAVSTSQFAGTVIRHLNDGTNNFESTTISAANSLTPTHALVADLDGDAFNDIIAASRIDAELAWYKNLGDGSFGAQNIIVDFDTAPTFLVWEDIETADVDGDGDTDIVTTEPNLGQIQWYANDGTGRFTAQPTIIDENVGALELVVADFEGDGDQDFLVVEVNSQTISWYLNDAGNFSRFEVANSVEIDFAQIDAGDIDGDGDMDVLLAANSYPPTSTVWFENVEGKQYRLSATIEDLRTAIDDVALVDIDGDGDLDTVIASYVGADDTIIRWYANLGNGAFSDEEHRIGTQFIVSELSFVDLDNDGDIDIFAPTAASNRIEWFDNNGAGEFSQRLVAENVLSLGETSGVGDINGDGFADLVTAHGAANAIVAYVSMNPFDLNLDKVIDIRDVDQLCGSIKNNQFVADLNGDGRTDRFDSIELMGGGFQSVVGDTDFDGFFSTSDLVAVFQANEFEDQIEGNSTWRTGDWNCDGEFSSRDLVFVFELDVFTPDARAIAAAIVGSDNTRQRFGLAANRSGEQVVN